MTKSWEFLRNFRRIIREKFGEISWGKIPKNFSGISRNWVSNLWSPKNLSSWGPILGNFSRISEESVTGNGSREILRKFLKESHLGWRIRGNSSLLLPGYGPQRVSFLTKFSNFFCGKNLGFLFYVYIKCLDDRLQF